MLEENIRVMRREKGLTQEQLAEVMGVSTASVSKWETGVAAPELTMLAALADYFEMSIDALIGHTVDKAQLEEKVAAVNELSLANEDDKALERAEELLRRYPNEYSVVDCAASAHYTAFIHKPDEKHMRRCMELIHRKYILSKDTSGKKWFEIQAELANCHELLSEWKKAKEYYEESNVAGLNDSHIARCLAGMEETDPAIHGFSSAIENKVFTLVSDLIQLANLWAKKREIARAIATYRTAIHIMEGCKGQMDLKAMELTCHFALAFMEQEEENIDAAKEHIRQAVHAELGKNLPEDDSKLFIKTKHPHKIIHSEFSGTCQVMQWLAAMGEEELLAVAKEEFEK